MITPRVFLSYHSPDRPAVVAIRTALEGYGINTFLDQTNLTPGLSWFNELQKELQQAAAVVVIIGPGELGGWQQREIQLALDEQVKPDRASGKLLVIPVLLPGVQPQQAPSFLMLNNGLFLRDGPTDPQAMARLAQALGAASPDPAPPLTTPALCPYRGLDVFREEDATLFFGRDDFAENLLQRVRQHPVVAVVGASGSGKSSVVQAGLLPRLRREGGLLPTWDAVICTPGSRPFYRLAVALLAILRPAADLTERLVQAGPLSEQLVTDLPTVVEEVLRVQRVDRLLLVVDQFEEVFTLTPPDQRDTFIAALLQAAPRDVTHRTSGLQLVFTLRADFYGAVLNASRDLSERLEQAQVNLGPARPDELRQMIEAPAHKAGLRFEPGLSDLILHKLTDQPGNLPLLEYALKGLWLERQGTLLTHAGYEATGEVEGAISRQADRVFAGLSATQQAACWRLFSRLVRVSAANEEGTDTRRRVPLPDLDEAAQDVARLFAAPDVRLLVLATAAATGRQVVEVAHEALIRSWPRLQAWLGQERSFLLWRQELEKDVAKWQAKGQSSDFLYARTELDEATHLNKGREIDLTPGEREFLAASRKRTGNTRLLRRTGQLAAAVALAAALGWGAWWYWLHTTIPGRIRLVENELVASGSETTDYQSQILTIHHYLLKGQVPQMLAATKQLPPELKAMAWQLLLKDSVLLAEHKLTPAILQQVRQLAKQSSGDTLAENSILPALAYAYGKLHDVPLAMATLHEAVAEAKQLDKKSPGRAYNLLLDIGQVYQELQATPQAVAALNNALIDSRTLNDTSSKITFLLRLAGIYQKLGQDNQAVATLRLAL